MAWLAWLAWLAWFVVFNFFQNISKITVHGLGYAAHNQLAYIVVTEATLK